MHLRHLTGNVISLTDKTVTFAVTLDSNLAMKFDIIKFQTYADLHTSISLHAHLSQPVYKHVSVYI